MPSVREIYKFDELTWPEVNQAVEMGKICILPTGSVEQHGRTAVERLRRQRRLQAQLRLAHVVPEQTPVSPRAHHPGVAHSQLFPRVEPQPEAVPRHW